MASREEAWPWVAPKLACDVGAAGVAAFFCSPVVAAIDRAITLNASGKHALWPALATTVKELGTAPRRVLLGAANRWLVFVYVTTYAAANTADTLTASKTAVLAASTVANSASCIAKDRAFARMYGVVAPKALPAASYAAFLVRDVASMAFVFTLPAVVASARDTAGGPDALDAAVQFSSPILAQYVTTPLHLVGLNVYNAPLASLAARAKTLAAQFPATVLARQLRIVPAFSLGGIVNRTLRQTSHAHCDQLHLRRQARPSQQR